MNKDGFNNNTRSFVSMTKGTTISQYRILEKIGAGGMGEVYLAEDTKLGRRVALKFLPMHLVSNEEIKARFLREAQTLAKLNHPNIVTIHDVSEFKNRPYYVMELVEGESLHGFAHEKSLPFDLVIEYAIQICQGLGEAHRAGIVHRDIKAANIIVDSKGRVRLLDFGLAAVAGDDGLTRSGSTLGTVSYMSPEQVSGREIDHRSDLFSLGIVLYELVAGRSPFKRDSEGATLKAIMEDLPEPLTRYKSDIPVKLQDVIMELLEKDKELRYQSAEGVIADLKRLIYDSTQSAYTRTSPEKPKRSKIPFLIFGTAICVAAAAALFFILDSTTEDNSASEIVPMIAVKPFENLGSPEDEYFADGITDEITSRLASISGLGVISRTSAMIYKNSNKNLKQIGQELGVDYILEGTVRWSKIGDKPRVRITPQLVRVSDDRHLWADNYERDMLEVFAVQADIATKIVDQLGITLVQKDRDNLNVRPTNNPEAYALYLRSLSMLGQLYQNSSNAPAMKAAIDSVVMLDPDFALAYALRSRIYSWAAFGARHSEDARVAKSSAERALQLEPGLPQGYIALGFYYNLVETNYERALSEFSKAESEIHSDPDLLDAKALVQLRQGRFRESAENFGKAAELDPLNPSRHRALAIPLRFMRSYNESNNAIDRAIALDPNSAGIRQDKLGLALSWRGDWQELRELALEAVNHCDSVEFLSGESSMMEYLPEFQWEKIMREFRDRFRGWVPIDYYSRLAQMNYDLGDSILASAYTDSLRIALEQKVSESPDDWENISLLGAAYSMLGDCDRGIEYGQLGLDSLSVDKCHW